MSMDALNKLLQENPAMYKALMAQATAEKSLYKFTELMWEFVEPANPFVGNWHLEAIAEHLQAVTDGHILRLLMNVPPGSMKSLMTDVFWPAWEWIHHPHYRYVCTSYSAALTERDNGRFGQVVRSDLYQAMWGDRFKLTRDSATKLMNDKTGWKLATSTEGMGTGERGDRVICIPFMGMILSSSGWLRIGDIVENRFDVKIAGWNGKNIIWQEIKTYEKNPFRKIIELDFGDGALRCTEDHLVFTSRGYIPAKNITAGEEVWSYSMETMPGMRQNDIQQAVPDRKKKILSKNLSHSGGKKESAYSEQPDMHTMRSDDISITRPFGENAERNILQSFLSWSAQSGSKKSSLAGWKKNKSMRTVLERIYSRNKNKRKNCKVLLIKMLRACAKTANQNLPSLPENIQSTHEKIKILLFPVRLGWVLGLWGGAERLSPRMEFKIKKRNKGKGWQKVHAMLYEAGGSRRNASRTSYRLCKGKPVPEKSNNSLQVLPWKNAWEKRPEGVLEKKVIKNIRYLSEKEENTYNISVEPCHNYFADGLLVHNCDDPHNVKDGESEATLKSTIQYFTEVLPTRVTNPISSAMIVIMQRVRENDVSGYILEHDLGYTHLCLPMEFETDRKCYTSLPTSPDDIFFEDPRTEPGELLFPARMPDWVVERDKKNMGPYACNTGEAPVLMSDLSMKRIADIVVGDELVGFETETNGAKNRRSLKKCTVLEKYQREAGIVKITFASGKSIRCTPDHKWYMGKQAKTRPDRNENDPIYQPAKTGKKLMRVCDPYLPALSPAEERAAGWLAGFFDGEGSVSLCKKDDHKSSAAVSFYQTCERNMPVCKKLEEYLNVLGFKYKIDERKRPKGWQRSRQYRLLDIGLPVLQKFLHTVRPVKWRDRMIEGAYRCKWIKEQEEIVSIEPAGKAQVYSMKTTTGNYVVWGLASSNCAGQFQQSPVPRGGGIIKSDYWKLWPEAGEALNEDGTPAIKLEYPEMDYIIATVDTAYSAKTSADFNALAVMGLFHLRGLPKIMLMHCWQKRLDFRGETLPRLPGEEEMDYKRRKKKAWGMLEWTAYECARFGVDKLIVENKATGITLSQEIRRVFQNESWAVELINPKGDKEMRTYAVQHLWAEGMIYAPDRAWAQEAINQMQSFPKGKNDDLHDCITQGAYWYRKSGWALRRDEISHDMRDKDKYVSGVNAAIYDV